MDQQYPAIQPFRSGSDRARLAVTVFYVLILLSVVSAISDYMEIDLLNRFLSGEEIQESVIDSNDIRQLLVVFVYMLSFWSAGIFFLMWFHRAHRNLPALGIQEPDYSPRWAVAGFFVPFINVWRPYQVMREVWNASDPDTVEGLSWKEMSPSPLVKWWWALFVLSVYIWNIALRLTLTGEFSPESIIQANWLYITSHLIDLPGLFVAIHLIKQIDMRQEEKFNIILPTMNYRIE
jgi:hypothetical protein